MFSSGTAYPMYGAKFKVNGSFLFEDWDKVKVIGSYRRIYRILWKYPSNPIQRFFFKIPRKEYRLYVPESDKDNYEYKIKKEGF